MPMSAPLQGNEDWLYEEPDEDELLTDWERDFLTSIELQDYDLTARQEEKRDEIYVELEIRRELWREGRYPRRVR
jgi:hypothetical protein